MAGKQKKIQFDFNVTEDSAAEVAADLVEELIKTQATKALLPHALEERDVFVEHVKELFTTSIEQAGACAAVCVAALPLSSSAPFTLPLSVAACAPDVHTILTCFCRRQC